MVGNLVGNALLVVKKDSFEILRILSALDAAHNYRSLAINEIFSVPKLLLSKVCSTL